jgi:hypothetical protein
MPPNVHERQLTFAPHGHILTNTGVWSLDGQWIVYDVRSDPAGAVFDGTRIERVHVETGEVQVLYESRRGACCGVATCSPVDDRVVFIHGPEEPTPDWQYSAYHRRGVVAASSQPGTAVTLDARDLVPPFTPGALRGGTHVHTFSSDGQWVAFTYEDHVLAQLEQDQNDHDLNQRNVGVSVPAGPVRVPQGHPRNHDGSHFSVLVTRTVPQPRPGADEIGRAFEDAWIGTNGYRKVDGTCRPRALAFLGQVVAQSGEPLTELFVVDLPADVTIPGDDGPLQGNATRLPRPPRGTVQRRLTYTADRKYPGLQGPRHWPRSSPDGSRIAFLMKDEQGVVQLWTMPPTGGQPCQLTRHDHDVASAFTWSPDSRWIAHVMDGSVFITNASTGEGRRLTPRHVADVAPRPEACVFAPDGRRIAYVRPVPSGGTVYNQVFVATVQRMRST